MNENKINDFINSFSNEILQESGVSTEGTETSKRLLEEVENRVVARLFLEMVALLTPEQASRVTKDSMGDEIPEFHIRMAKALQSLRGELIEDFKKLTEQK